MTAEAPAPERGFTARLLDGIERVGNKVPHPVMMFLYLIGIIIVLSAVMNWAGVTATEEIAVPVSPGYVTDDHGGLGGTDVPYPVYPIEPDYDDEYEIVEVDIAINSLLSTDGRRFLYTSFVDNFASFAVVAVVFVAMMGVGVAEYAGMMGALIRRLVKVAPRGLIAFILIFVGVLSSVATDAGYLILIPLSAAAFMTIGRHPLAGMAAAFAGVGAVFAVNLLITPLDAMLTEISNEAIVGAGGEPITVTANFFFSTVSSIVIALVALFVTVKITEPRLGTYDVSEADLNYAATDDEVDEAAEAKGLRYALWGFLAMIAIILVGILPPNAPLRHPETGAIIGNTPFMDSLIFIITLVFLVCGVCYGKGAKTIDGSGDVITGVTKTFAGLAGLVLMLLMISQFIAYFNWTNIPRWIAIEMAQLLEAAPFGALTLLIAMIVVLVIIDIIMPGAVPAWAIFAPVFIPVFMQLNVPPQTVLAAYRIGDSPMNVITPLMVYLPFIVTIAQSYKKDAGLGTVIALMLPYALVILVAWIALFIAWFLLGIPLGPGYPVGP